MAKSHRLEPQKAALIAFMLTLPETGAAGALQDAWEAVVRCALGDVTEARHRNEGEHPLALALVALHSRVTQDFATDVDPVVAGPWVCAMPCAFSASNLRRASALRVLCSVLYP